MTFQKQSFLVLTLLETIFTRLTNQVSCYLKAVYFIQSIVYRAVHCCTAVSQNINLQKEGPSQDSNMKALGAVETENVCFSNQGEHNSI